MEAAMMGADIDGEVLVYLEMAQVNFDVQPAEGIKGNTNFYFVKLSHA